MSLEYLHPDGTIHTISDEEMDRIARELSYRSMRDMKIEPLSETLKRMDLRPVFADPVKSDGKLHLSTNAGVAACGAISGRTLTRYYFRSQIKALNKVCSLCRAIFVR